SQCNCVYPAIALLITGRRRVKVMASWLHIISYFQ
uniref:Uncharacterized protein n=1 Tax=Amphimedon queenslandica TaxID=400682 RepID=A0A1X7VMC6_AMPQE